MDNLQKLQAANPHIQIHTIHEAAFRRYGSVIQEDTSPFCAAAETIPFPDGEQVRCFDPGTGRDSGGGEAAGNPLRRSGRADRPVLGAFQSAQRSGVAYLQ